MAEEKEIHKSKSGGEMFSRRLSAIHCLHFPEKFLFAPACIAESSVYQRLLPDTEPLAREIRVGAITYTNIP